MDDLIHKLATSDTHDDLIRNIISLRQSKDLFDDLSDDPDERQVAVQLEIDTKPPQYTTEVPIINRPFEEAALIEAVEFPFNNWSASRYSPGNFGVWYGASSIETTVYETVHHWLNFLRDSGNDTEGAIIERKLWSVRCDAILLDFRELVDEYPQLVHESDYTFTHDLGRRLHKEGHPGLISKSARCDGDIYAIFNHDVLSSPKNMCYLTYRLEGDATIIERDPGTVFMSVP